MAGVSSSCALVGSGYSSLPPRRLAWLAGSALSWCVSRTALQGSNRCANVRAAYRGPKINLQSSCCCASATIAAHDKSYRASVV